MKPRVLGETHNVAYTGSYNRGELKMMLVQCGMAA